MLWVSTNGGKVSRTSVTGGNYHSDTHALWVNPAITASSIWAPTASVYLRRQGNTGRFVESLPVSHFTMSALTMPRLTMYTAAADNGSWMGPSRNRRNNQFRLENVGYGDGFYTYADKTEPDVVYSQYQGGRISRFQLPYRRKQVYQALPEEGVAD